MNHFAENRGTRSSAPGVRRPIRYVRPGVVLLVTLVFLVVLSVLGYTLTARVAAQRHRDQYLIDYSKARYGCDSAVKYALATLQDINEPQLIERPDEPDFSDLFMMTEEQHAEFLAEWAAQKALEDEALGETGDNIDVNDVNNVDDFGDITDFNEPHALRVRGPYGPPWPFITEPVEFEIGSATVKIEIEDENTKYPLTWMLLPDKTVGRRIKEAGLESFCEWMWSGVKDAEQLYTDIEALKLQLKDVAAIKPFKTDFKPLPRIVKEPITVKRPTSTSRRYRTRNYKIVKKTISVSDQIDKQATDFAKLFHSSLIDIETLARPTIVGEERKESALKYMGLWATRKVNVNTAPRHVLEAAFTFGGDEVDIAEAVIQRRREEPFKDIEDLKKSLLRYSDSIQKCEKYITTVSRFFTIKITAVSGVAKASAVIAVAKDGKKVKTVGIISG